MAFPTYVEGPVVLGWENQEAGDWGEATVKAKLSEYGVTSASLDPDLGEDFLVEVGGREASATGNHPRSALIQVKACIQECHNDEINVAGIKTTRLKRWSVQQLPVFIVAVSGFSTRQPRFFIRSIDDFLQERFSGTEIRDVQQHSVTVAASSSDSFPESLIDGIDQFHRFVEADLTSANPSEKRNEHYEVVWRSKPNARFQKATPVSWKVIWRSSRRPAYFNAMMADLYRTAHEAYFELSSPAYVSFHIYRSQYDLNHNMAVARVHWVDDRHARSAIALDALGKRNPRTEYIETDVGEREFVESKSMNASGFVSYVENLAPRLDEFATRLLGAESSTKGGKSFWTDQEIATLNELESAWEATPFPPTEFKVLEDILGGYVHALSGHMIFAGKADWNPDGENDRYRRETAEEVRCYYGAWRILLKNSGWEL